MQSLNTVLQPLRSLNLLGGIFTFCRKNPQKTEANESPVRQNVYFTAHVGTPANAAVLKMLCLRFLDGITLVLFKYPSHNKAFHLKASSTYFLLGLEIEHLFLRCFLSPNGKERTDCIPLRFGPSLHKRRLLVLHS